MACSEKGLEPRRNPRLVREAQPYLVELAEIALKGWYGDTTTAAISLKWNKRNSWCWFVGRKPIPLRIVRHLIRHGPRYGAQREAAVRAKAQAMVDKELARIAAASEARARLASIMAEIDAPLPATTLTHTRLGYQHQPRLISQARKATQTEGLTTVE